MAPIIPFLTDSPPQLEATVEAIAAAGATHVTPIVLHLRTGAREWFSTWLGEHHPNLIPQYERLYGPRAYAPKAYQDEIGGRVHELARRHGVGRSGPRDARRIRPRNTSPAPVPPEQLPLL
jgi:DNA repair photolyase